MLRIIFTVLVSIPAAFAYLIGAGHIMRHKSRYSEQERYSFIRKYTATLSKNARITTTVSGTENLPESGGYVLFPNHQGKYDAIGILNAHEEPLSIVMDKKRSYLLFANQCISILSGVRLDRTSIRTQLSGIKKIVQEVKNGKRFIVFPEGGYHHNRNRVQVFKAGAFKSAIKAKAPIVPVALIDSWRPFELNSIRKVTTQVHFLPPLYYEEYKAFTSQQIAEKVQSMVEETIAKHEKNSDR